MKMIQANKMVFNYHYTMMMSAYEENKLFLNMLLNQTDIIPAEGKKAFEEWLQSYRRSCEDLKKKADDGYQIAEACASAANHEHINSRFPFEPYLT
jgi:hypothetical protein